MLGPFDDWDVTQAALSETLPLDDTALGRELARMYRRAVRDEHEAPSKEEAQVGNWVIRDDDLELFRVTRDSIVTLASTSFMFKNLSLASLSSLGFGLISLLRNVYRSGIRLPREQAMVLACLRQMNRPSTPDEIADTLNWRERDLTGWSAETVRAALEGLGSAVARRDVIALVKEVDGRWVVTGS